MNTDYLLLEMEAWLQDKHSVDVIGNKLYRILDEGTRHYSTYEVYEDLQREFLLAEKTLKEDYERSKLEDIYQDFLHSAYLQHETTRFIFLASIPFKNIDGLLMATKVFMDSVPRIIKKKNKEDEEEIIDYLVDRYVRDNINWSYYGFPKFLLRNNYLKQAQKLFTLELPEYPLVDEAGLTMDEFIDVCNDDMKRFIVEEMNKAFLEA